MKTEPIGLKGEFCNVLQLNDMFEWIKVTFSNIDQCDWVACGYLER